MKVVGFLIIIILSFPYVFSQNEKYIENPITVEIEAGPYKSIRLFSDGMLCKATLLDSYESIYKFYPIRDLDYKYYVQLQKIFKDNNIINYNSTIEDTNIRVTGTKLYFVIIDKDYNINTILWVSGKNPTLEKIIKLINEIIPKEDRQLFSFKVKYW